MPSATIPPSSSPRRLSDSDLESSTSAPTNDAAPTDQELVARALLGDQSAYAEIVSRFERPLFSLIVRMVRDRERAEDLCQEAFVKAFRALPSYDSGRKFSSWLFKIGHNATIDSMRRQQLDTMALEGDEEERGWERVLADASTPSPLRHAAGSALGEAMERCVLALRPDYREAFLLRFVEGLSYQEIADVLSLPMGTVKTNLHRARKEFASLLAEEGFGEGTESL